MGLACRWPSDYVGTVPQSHPRFLPEEKIGCYIVLEASGFVKGNTAYEIQRSNNGGDLVLQS